ACGWTGTPGRRERARKHDARQQRDDHSPQRARTYAQGLFPPWGPVPHSPVYEKFAFRVTGTPPSALDLLREP
ncbi:MAG TPA: hypothetical protein VG408_09305, partial [Actinomycetota bacterium]|nr:hypothetical protein [Actinomycetota bacterium]